MKNRENHSINMKYYSIFHTHSRLNNNNGRVLKNQEKRGTPTPTMHRATVSASKDGDVSFTVVPLKFPTFSTFRTLCRHR